MISIKEIDPRIKGYGADETDLINAALQSPKAAGRKIFFPAGVYLFTKPLYVPPYPKPFSIEGEGFALTKFFVYGLTDYFIKFNGKETKPNEDYQQGYAFTASDILFAGDKSKAGCINLDYSGHCYFENVWFRDFNGPAVSGRQWWDTTFDCCHFIRCGSVVNDQAAIQMEGYKHIAHEWCNNIVFDNCRWELCPYNGVYCGHYSTRIRVVSCKFDRVGVDAVVFEGADPSIIDATQFVHTGRNAVRCTDSRGIIISNSLFDADHTGVMLDNASYCNVSNNAFGIRIPLDNKNIEVTKLGAGVVIDRNSGVPGKKE